MKSKITLILLLLVGAALTYTACKKSGTSPAKSTVDAKTVSSQVALNVVATLDGAFGGFNFSDGLDAPGTFGVTSHNGLKMADLGTNDVCGKLIDTTYTDSETTSDGQTSFKMQYQLTLNCSGGIYSGFHLIDSLNVALSSSQYSGTYGIGENVTLASLQPGVDEAKYSVNGTFNVNLDLNYKTSKAQSFNDVFDYKFNQVIIDPSGDGDIVSGSANFYTKGSIANGNWEYVGTITFLGNHKAKVTISGATYNVDLQTGVVS